MTPETPPRFGPPPGGRPPTGAETDAARGAPVRRDLAAAHPAAAALFTGSDADVAALVAAYRPPPADAPAPLRLLAGD